MSEWTEFTTGFRCCGTALFWYIAETGSNSLLSKVLVKKKMNHSVVIAIYLKFFD